MNIIFDLDGTLIDSKERLYRLFQYLVPQSLFTFDEYWSLKKNKVDHRKILTSYFSFSDNQINSFEKNWRSQIELKTWLNLDKPFAGVREYLLGLKDYHQLYLVTARQFESPVYKQIIEWGWNDIFKEVMVTQQNVEKYDIIMSKVIRRSSKDWMIGDTGIDILTGKRLKMKTAGVLSGFLNREKLKDYDPDLILNYVTEMKYFYE